MKHKDLVRHIEQHGYKFVREGKEHTLYINKQRGLPPCHAIVKFQGVRCVLSAALSAS